MEDTIQSWWYEQDGQQRGPVNGDEIVKLIGNGVIKIESLIWTNDYNEWKNIRETEFSQHFVSNVPPPLAGTIVDKNFVWLLAFAPLIGKFLEGFFLEIFYPKPTLDGNNFTNLIELYYYKTHTDVNAFWFVTLALNFYLCYLDQKNYRQPVGIQKNYALLSLQVY